MANDKLKLSEDERHNADAARILEAHKEMQKKKEMRKEKENKENKDRIPKALLLIGAEDGLTSQGRLHFARLFDVDNAVKTAKEYIVLRAEGGWAKADRQAWIRDKLKEYDEIQKEKRVGRPLKEEIDNYFT